jgi:hypothetical protein
MLYSDMVKDNTVKRAAVKEFAQHVRPIYARMCLAESKDSEASKMLISSLAIVDLMEEKDTTSFTTLVYYMIKVVALRHLIQYKDMMAKNDPRISELEALIKADDEATQAARTELDKLLKDENDMRIMADLFTIIGSNERNPPLPLRVID